jgi:hypothetical protein
MNNPLFNGGGGNTAGVDPQDAQAMAAVKAVSWDFFFSLLGF